jgi:hypothetical protein
LGGDDHRSPPEPQHVKDDDCERNAEQRDRGWNRQREPVRETEARFEPGVKIRAVAKQVGREYGDARQREQHQSGDRDREKETHRDGQRVRTTRDVRAVIIRAGDRLRHSRVSGAECRTMHNL